MSDNFILDKTFDTVDYTKDSLDRGTYENCQFRDCNFSNSDLSLTRFLECEFVGCNLSMITLGKTAFQNIKFKDCKMLGLKFEDCDTFSFAVSFNICVLDFSSFYGLKMKNTLFVDSILNEVDFTECNLSASTFSKCDLSRSIFENTNLEKVDFRTAYNFTIDPSRNRIRKAKFSVSGVKGLLNKYDIIIEE